VTAAASHVAFDCSGCHKVPADALTAGHIDPSPAEVAFTGLAGASAAYNPSTRQCTNVYCHGNGKAGSGGSALWTGSLSGGCAACHDDETKGTAMLLGGRHQKHVLGEGLGCSTCHGCVVNSSKQVTDATRHVNGKVDVCLPSWNPTARTCSPGCHGTETW
jgi:predicted CxxxxCH...CXXCH cytochrome family protein